MAGATAGPASAAVAPTRVGTGNDAWVHVDRQGVTHVAWSVTDGLQSVLHYRRRPPGGAFGPDRVLPVATGTEFGGNYVVQDPPPSNRLVLITERCCETPSTYALTSTDGGTTWSAARPVYEGSPAFNPSDGPVNLVASASNGVWLIHGNPDIRAVQLPPSLDRVVPRSAGTLLSGSAPYDGSVVLDEAGAPVFAYGDLHRTFVRRGTAGAEIPVANYPELVSTIKIAGGARGVVAVVTGGRPGAAFLESRRLAGNAFTSPVRLTAPADSSPGVPFVTADQTGRFHLVWRSANAVRYRRSENGTAWTAPSTIVAAGSPVFELVASAGPDGAGWALWHQGTGSAPIFVAPLAASATAAPQPPPPPVAGRTVNVAVVSGTVRVRLRGTNRFVDLRRLRQVPTGSELDTLRGRVRLTSAAARGTQTGLFYNGRFVVTQRRTGARLTDLRLSGPLAARAARRAAARRHAAGSGGTRRARSARRAATPPPSCAGRRG